MTQHAGRMRTLPLAKQQRGPWPAVTLDGGGVYVQAMMYPSKLSVMDPAYKFDLYNQWSILKQNP